MRCPHCAARAVEPPLCRVCGLSLNAPAEQPVLAGLEPTVAPAAEVGIEPLGEFVPTATSVPQVGVEPLPDLIPRVSAPEVKVEAFAELVPTVASDASVAPEAAPRAPPRCPICQMEVSLAERLCPGCGHVLRPRKRKLKVELSRCSRCGSAQRPGASRCGSCGSTL